MERETGSWGYRLPAAGDISGAGERSVLNRLLAGTSYWLDQSKGFVWAKGSVLLPNSVIQEAIYSDLARALIYLSYSDTQKRSFLPWRQRLFHYRSNSRREDMDIQHIIDSYLDIYITLVILEKRVQGKLPACEGILIVKERKKDGSIISTMT